ncbi:hypothetical protein BDP81DRAFT_127407 [Colletotrichum phormii]|uniref:Uncharacterized protein n=1 Tax=Colletotrichum phormii TaxID=359342 RepID=A0AAI9ZZH4_9PEZI|nr:uncharacterized protein BDP81DRAFT_127407 [Colletotrichum phormii]KAK1641104.1 hypothetical protein BDP81DRAFT_127407 [Colletotrichum phormii]
MKERDRRLTDGKVRKDVQNGNIRRKELLPKYVWFVHARRSAYSMLATAATFSPTCARCFHLSLFCLPACGQQSCLQAAKSRTLDHRRKSAHNAPRESKDGTFPSSARSCAVVVVYPNDRAFGLLVPITLGSRLYCISPRLWPLFIRWNCARQRTRPIIWINYQSCFHSRPLTGCYIVNGLSPGAPPTLRLIRRCITP